MEMAPALKGFVCILCLIYTFILSVSTSEKTIEFLTSISQNQNGQWLTHFSKEDGNGSNWKLNIRHRITEYAGVNSNHLIRILSVSSPQPVDYELLPSLGYYKFHKKTDNGFDTAVSVCAQEGGHLAIINSVRESEAIKELYGRSDISDDWVYVGLKKHRNNEWRTIFGKPLASTGFTRWAKDQPDNYGDDEFCGSIDRDGLYNDIDCYGDHPFLCEYDLSWNTD